MTYSPPRTKQKYLDQKRSTYSLLTREQRRVVIKKNAVYRDAHRAKVRTLIDAAKSGGCVDCGEKDPIVLDLDHVRGTKFANVSRMFDWAIPLVEAEISKCEPRCANCHRRVTYSRRGGGQWGS